MNNVTAELNSRTDFGTRWCEMLTANEEGILSKDALRTITMNVVQKQERSKLLRRDRHVQPKSDQMARPYFEARETALIMNASDGAILNEMEEVRREAGLDMSEIEQAWFDYVTSGGDLPELQEAVTERDDAPF